MIDDFKMAKEGEKISERRLKGDWEEL